MADTTLPGVLLTGDHASRPAATAVATGTVYACSTHDLIYQSDGSSWATWSDVSGASGGVLTTQGDILYRDGSGLQRLAIGTADQVLTVNSGATAPEWADASGGSGGGWTQDVNEDGTSFANFTGATGTWASNGTIIQQTDSTSGTKFARHSTARVTGNVLIVQCDVRSPSSGQVGGSNESLGIMLRTASGGSSGAPIFGLRWDSGASGRAYWEANASSLKGTSSMTLNRDTWYTLRVVAADGVISGYVDGTLKGSYTIGAPDAADVSYVGMITQWQLKGDFRNFKVWSLTLPA